MSTNSASGLSGSVGECVPERVSPASAMRVAISARTPGWSTTLKRT